MSRITFTPEITFGHIIQFTGMICAGVALWINMDRRLTALEIRQEYATQAMNRVISYIDGDVMSKPLSQRKTWSQSKPEPINE